MSYNFSIFTFVYTYVSHITQQYAISAYWYVWTHLCWYAKILRVILMQQTSKHIRHICGGFRFNAVFICYCTAWIFVIIITMIQLLGECLNKSPTKDVLEKRLYMMLNCLKEENIAFPSYFTKQSQSRN